MVTWNKGFTLIELSIVLVIIGLVVGGVLVGKDLIHNAQMQSLVSDTQKLDTAVNTFQLKYNCVPGDCPYGMSLGLGLWNTDGGSGSYPCNNGNGDNYIGCQSMDSCGGWPAACVWTPASEEAMALINMTNMGAIPGYEAIGIGHVVPTRVSQVGLYPISFHSGESVGNYILLTNMRSYANPWGVGGGGPALVGSLYPSEALWLDTKMDDGKANSGRLRPTSVTNSAISYNTENVWVGTADCWSGADYITSVPSWRSCLLHMKMSGR